MRRAFSSAGFCGELLSFGAASDAAETARLQAALAEEHRQGSTPPAVDDLGRVPSAETVRLHQAVAERVRVGELALRIQVVTARGLELRARETQ